MYSEHDRDSDVAAVVDDSLEERRRYKREPVALAGRQFEPAENREAECRIADISLGGVRIESDVAPPLGARVVVYIEGFGRFEGSVVRSGRGSFGLEFSCSAHKREKLAEQLTQYVNGLPLENTALRRHSRMSTNAVISFTRASGEIVKCRVLDFSYSGVFLATESRPPVGEFVLINQVPGRVARHHDSGIAIEFLSHERATLEAPQTKLFAVG
jgi:hypothetical protein